MHRIFLIFLVAIAAPLLAQTRAGARVPVVVFEVVLGIVIGPHVLGFIADDEFLSVMRTAGMVTVMFMAGMEMDFAQIRGRPLTLALIGWTGSVVIATVAVGALHVMPGVLVPMMVVIALTTTGLGSLLPILRDGGQLETQLGRMLLAAGTVGEVGPIVAASLVLSNRFSTWQELALLAAFLALVGFAAAVGTGLRPPKVIALLSRTLHASTQLPVRLALFLLASLIVISEFLGFEAVFGAFAAGMILGIATRGPEGEQFRTKIDAVCFGWFAPFFFVGTGVAFDVATLTRSVPTMLLLPVFLLLFVLLRGLPVILYRRELGKPERGPFALYSAVASLSLVVVIANVGLKSQHMSPDVAQALIGAALLSLLLYPTLARMLLPRPAAAPPVVD